jgi:hypothetical protein
MVNRLFPTRQAIPLHRASILSDHLLTNRNIG